MIQTWLASVEVTLLTFIAIIVCLFSILILLLRTQHLKKNQILWDEIQQAVLGVNQSLQEHQQRGDLLFAEERKRLFTQLIEDREKQLTSINELRILLEKRFAQSQVEQSNDFQEFKIQMITRFDKLQLMTSQSLSQGLQQTTVSIHALTEKLTQMLDKSQTQNQQAIVDNIRQGIVQLREDLQLSLKSQTESMTQSINQLTQSNDAQLKEISGQVEKRLTEGFDKTTQTFNDVLKRLALIDDAQKKITELSTNVVSLQEILNDKRSRGAFGEVQLQSLVSNVMPQTHYVMQKKLSNATIADCVLTLPEPTGKIAIDAKFPLENYKKMMDVEVAVVDRKEAGKQFAKDIKKHINDIANKYILPAETTDGAVMFIPAESVFAEIHGHYPDLVAYAYQRKVWMVSPTTLMAILTTASSVIKDEKTRQQVHIIKQHLSVLGQDFMRFKERMGNLSKHIGLVSKDVELVHTSARKISSRFDKIEQVELEKEKMSENIQKTKNLIS